MSDLEPVTPALVDEVGQQARCSCCRRRPVDIRVARWCHQCQIEIALHGELTWAVCQSIRQWYSNHPIGRTTT